jgi:hypothetical protein
VANASIVCWNCKALAVIDHSECPQCKAGLSPSGRGLTEEQFLEEQRSLRRQAGIADSELAMEDFAPDWPFSPVVRPNGALELKAKIVTGLGLEPKTNLIIWFGDDQIYLLLRKDPPPTYDNFGKPLRVRHQVLEAVDVGYIRIESAGTKSNIGALALFGVLALGAKRDWSALSMGLTDSELVLLVREPLYALRNTLSRAIEVCPSLRDKIAEGPPPPQLNAPAVPAAPTAPQPGVIDELERLTNLYEKGLIDDQEFRAMKATLIQSAQEKAHSEES